MTGGGGDDIFVVDAVGDTITELAGGGTDMVKASVNFSLASRGHNVEKLALFGSGLKATGTSADERFYQLRHRQHAGRWGWRRPLPGQRFRYGDNRVADRRHRRALRQWRQFLALGPSLNIERLVLLGSGLVGTGTAGDDQIYSHGVGNTLRGGDGDDDFIVDSASTSITEHSGQGIDSVTTDGVSFSLSARGLNVENLRLSGAGNTSATGNGLDNLLIGNAGDNTLIGNLGDDVLIGGLAPTS